MTLDSPPMSQEHADEQDNLVVHESGYRQGTRAVVPESDGQKFKVRVMGWEPGATVVEGSSADYPIDRIKRDFGASFPKGTRMRANHDSMCEAGGDIRRIWAKTTSELWEEEDGMYAEAIAAEGEPSDFIRQFGDVIGTSVTVSVELQKQVLLDEDGKPELNADGDPIYVPAKSERGAWIVERFLPLTEAPYNSIDFVEVPGADGAVVTLALESARRIVEGTTIREAATFAIDLAGKREKTSLGVAEGAQPGSTPAPGSTTEKESRMEQKDIEALAEALTAPFKPLLSFVAEHKAAADAAAAGAAPGETATESAIEKAITALEAIDAAKLVSKTAKESLIADVKAGKDITEALAHAVAVQAESIAESAAQGPEYTLAEGRSHSFAIAGLQG
ncbi:hypothetical protein GCM10027071_14730 [Microbacterium marinum]